MNFLTFLYLLGYHYIIYTTVSLTIKHIFRSNSQSMSRLKFLRKGHPCKNYLVFQMIDSLQVYIHILKWKSVMNLATHYIKIIQTQIKNFILKLHEDLFSWHWNNPEFSLPYLLCSNYNYLASNAYHMIVILSVPLTGYSLYKILLLCFWCLSLSLKSHLCQIWSLLQIPCIRHLCPFLYCPWKITGTHSSQHLQPINTYCT